MSTIAFPFASPLGDLNISIRDGFLVAMDFADESKIMPATWVADEADRVETFSMELTNWFNGSLTDFTFPISLEGTPFQKRVWEELLKIPFGDTISYQELARRLGDPKCIRAAAAANGRNPIPVVVPCHRVIGKDGTLTGYSGGLWRKEWLLEHERNVLGLSPIKSVQLNLFGEL